MNAFSKQNRGRLRIYSASARITGRMLLVVLIFAGLLALVVFYCRRPSLTNSFYLRALQTGKLIGPVSLPRGQFPPSSDEQTYIVAEPAESELELRSRLLRSRVLVTLTNVPLDETLSHIFTSILGSKAPPVQIDLADESKMPQISIDLRNVSGYEALCICASKANVYFSIENDTIVMSRKEYKARQALENEKESEANDSDDMPKPQAALPAKPKVVEHVVCEPNRLKLLLDKENAGCPKITLRSLNGQPFSIKAIGSPAGYITAKYDPDVKATEFVLEPKVHPEKLKNLTGRLTIYLNHPDGTFVYVKYNVMPEYTVNPPMLVVFNAEPQQPVARKISVLNNYDKDFEIESISSNNNVVGINVLKQTKTSNGYQLDLEVTPPTTNEKTKFMDELSVNLKGGEKLAVRCDGYYRK